MDYSKKFLNKEYIIFDFDGTIARILFDWDLWRKVMFELIIKYEPTYTLDQSISKNTNRLIKKYGKLFLEEIISINEQFEMEYYESIDPNILLIKYIKNNFQQKNMYLYTSNSKKLITKLLSQLGLTNCFNKIVTRNDVKYIKPDPYGMWLLLDKNIDITKCIMVGDSVSDRGVARKVEMEFLQVII